MADEDMVCRRQGISMPLAAWRLLGEYLAVIDYDRFGRDQSKVNYTQVAGGILATFLISHAEDIRRDLEKVRLATVKESIPHFFSTSQLAAISSASRSDIPDVFRIGYRQRKIASRAEARRALRSVAAGPKNPASRLTDEPRKVRGGGR